MRVNHRGNYRQLLEEMLTSYRLAKVEEKRARLAQLLQLLLRTVMLETQWQCRRDTLKVVLLN